MANDPTPNWLMVKSTPVLLWLHGKPRWVFPLLISLVLLGGLTVPNYVLGGALLTLVGLILTWLVALSWKLMALPAKAMRLVLLSLVFGYALARFAGAA